MNQFEPFEQEGREDREGLGSRGPSSRPSRSSCSNPNRPVLIAGALIALAAFAAYANSFSGPFLFLDVPAIVDNPTIRHLWPIGPVLMPPSAGGLTVGGRPLVNLSLALNYALGGTEVWGYHAFNLVGHILAGLTLFGIVRRTLDRKSDICSRRGLGFQPMLGNEHGLEAQATFLAFAVALLWTLHPLQTESVTWIIQRAESMMGLFYLLTLYGFIRYADESESDNRKAESGNVEATLETKRAAGLFRVSAFRFSILSVAACLMGMATKEVMVSAPVIVLLYDRTFVSGTFREAWRRHRRLHLGLAATWILLAGLVAGTGGSRGGTSGFGVGVAWWAYALTQFPAVLTYLRLALWPHPLNFHYGAQWVKNPVTILAPAAVVIFLLGATAWALFGKFRSPTSDIRNLRALGFCGAFFFAILAPTSLVPGATQTAAEHRMYLALAPVLAVIVVAGYAGCERLVRWVRQRRRCVPLRPDDDTRRNAASAFIPLLAVALVFGVLTARRNAVYRSELALWSDTVSRSPWNPYPFNNLGIALVKAGRREEAVAQFTRALRLKPDYAEAHNNLGLALADSGRLPEAIGEYETALRLKPDYPEGETDLGVALTDTGRLPEAIGHLSAAVRLDPDYAEAHNNLAVALASAGRLAEAIAQYREVLRLQPRIPEVHYNLACALLGSGRTPEAVAEYEAALAIRPDYSEAQADLGVALADAGRLPEAVAAYERAVRLTPGDADVRHNLGLALQALGRTEEARAEFAAASRLRSQP